MRKFLIIAVEAPDDMTVDDIKASLPDAVADIDFDSIRPVSEYWIDNLFTESFVHKVEWEDVEEGSAPAAVSPLLPL